MLDYAQREGTVALKEQTAVPLTCAVTLWQEAEYDTDSLTSHPAPCHLIRELYKAHLDPGVVSKKKESGSGAVGSQGAGQCAWV